MFSSPVLSVCNDDVNLATQNQADYRLSVDSLGEMKSGDQLSLPPTKVRWFYKDGTSKKWIPFCGYDSINIEIHYLRSITLKSAAYSDRKSRTSSQQSKPLLVREGLYEVNILLRQCFPVYWEAPAGSTEILRGTWFKDPGGPQCVPIDDESIAEQLEMTHISLMRRLAVSDAPASGNNLPEVESDADGDAEVASRHTSIFSAQPKSPPVHTLKFADCHVDWLSLDEVYLYAETASFYIRQKLGMQKVGTRLGRGYYEEADLSAVPPVFSHLCFVVHGMGQKYLKGSIITACDGIRETARKLIDSYFPDISASEHRVEFLPVEWRNSLRLDGDVVDSITLGNLARLRTFLNCTFMDIMYYTSPLYRYEINQSLLVELNRLYCLFCERHPYFEANGGKVSILAHSLGSVISYDLITGWIEPVPQHLQPSLHVDKQTDVHTVDGDLQSNGTDNSLSESSVLLAKLEAAKEVVKCLETQLERQQLNEGSRRSPTDPHSLVFASRLQNLFCMGSPLAVYLTLRGIRPGQTGCPDAVMPRSKCPHIYNVFHPADPVAYRLEPLLMKRYSTIPPVEIYRCTDPSKVPYDLVHANSTSNQQLISQHSLPAGISYIDEALHNGSLTNDISSSSMESLTYIGSRFSRRLPLSSFMLGFFKSSTEAEPAASPPPPVSPKRQKSSSPTSPTPTDPEASSCLEAEEEQVTFELPASSHPSEDDVSTRANSTSPPPTELDSPVPLHYRMDYQLKESRYENAYLSALTVHTGYWSNADLVMFVLMQLFPESTPVDCPMPTL
uniref:DDHD domain-containing protein n=2 Tax=Mesocestoides corti TaxID=53468 RepID=A0A5K3F392_MESCO